jgi:hypothetical protein
MSSWIDKIPAAARTYIENNRLDEVECVIADLPGIARGKAGCQMGAPDFVSPAQFDLLPDDHR